MMSGPHPAVRVRRDVEGVQEAHRTHLAAEGGIRVRRGGQGREDRRWRKGQEGQEQGQQRPGKAITLQYNSYT